MMEEQQAYMQVQQMQQQMQQMQQHIEQLDEKLEDAQELKNSMGDFAELESGEKVLVPLANGIFARATLDDVESLKVNVGGGVVVSKSISETEDLIEEQVQELKKVRENAQDQYNQLMQQAQQLAQQLRG